MLQNHRGRVGLLVVGVVVGSLLAGAERTWAQQDKRVEPSADTADQATPAPQADPAALKAFAELVQSYRKRPALTVKSTLKIEAAQNGAAANGSEVKGEFTFGPKRAAVIKMRGYTCFLTPAKEGETEGTLWAIHEGTDHSYFTMSDDGSPYYALLNVFFELPYPELAIGLGEDEINDVLQQLHPKAPWIQPTAVTTKETEGKKTRVLTLASPTETMTLNIDPATNLIQSAELRITGGDMVQDGAALTYRYTYEYETPDKALPASTFEFNPGPRQRVDTLASLMPRPVVADADEDEDAPNGAAGGGMRRGALVGKPAPPIVLATADGKAVDLSELRGRVVIVDFWASWCGPCMSALPMLHEVAKWADQQELPVTVVTINVWEIRDRETDNPNARLASAKATWKKKNFTLPIAMDFTDEIAAAYMVTGIPTSLVIRSDGIVHSQHVGAGGNYVENMKQEIQEAIEAVGHQPDDGHEH